MALRRKYERLPESALSRGWIAKDDLGGGGQSFTVGVERNGTPGVLKFLRVQRRVSVERFRREVEIVEGISHQSIVRLLDSDLSGPSPWCVSPKGTPLEAYWRGRRRDLPRSALFDEALTIVRQLADALATVHERRVVHRDIKPGNVVVLEGRFVLIDFGIAYRPSDVRLTKIDGNPVANTVAAPADAYYRSVDEPKPSWDCLGLAWLWAWLLMRGRKPKYDRYHWRFHHFIRDQRTEYVRAVLAGASVPELAPTDGDAMRRIIEGLFPSVQAKVEAMDFSRAKVVIAQDEARQRQKKAEQEEYAAAAAEQVAVRVDPIRSDLLAAFREAEDEKMTLRLQGGSPFGERSTRQLLVAAVLGSTARDLECLAGPTPTWRFAISIDIQHYASQETGLLPFEIWVSFETAGGDRGKQIGYRYRLCSDGTLLLTDSRNPEMEAHVVDDGHPARTVREWLQEPEHWRAT